MLMFTLMILSLLQPTKRERHMHLEDGVKIGVGECEVSEGSFASLRNVDYRHNMVRCLSELPSTDTSV